MPTPPTYNYVLGMTYQDILDSQQRPLCMWTMAISYYFLNPQICELFKYVEW